MAERGSRFNPLDTGEASDNLKLPFEAPGDAYTSENSAEIPSPEVNNADRQFANFRRQNAADARTAFDPPVRSAWTKRFSFGNAVRPENNTLHDYKKLMRQGEGALHLEFSPTSHPGFDGAIASAAGIDKYGQLTNVAFNAAQPDYKEFAPLRRNIAILRNYLVVTMFPDAEFKAHVNSPEGRQDAKNLENLQKMAVKLGAALAAETHKPFLFQRWFGSVKRLVTGGDMSAPYISPFMAAANVPDQGIATMYDYLMKEQGKTSFSWTPPFIEKNNWGLPPREQTPFSEASLAADSRSSAMSHIVDAMEHIVSQLRSVDTLSVQNKETSVEEGRKILENLRIRIGNGITGEEMELTDPSREHARKLLQVAYTFRDAMAEFARIDPNLLRDPMLQNAIGAFERLSFRAKEEAKSMLEQEGNLGAADAMGKRMDAAPSKDKAKEPFNNLLATLQAGMDEVAKIEKTLPFRSPSPQRGLEQAKTNQMNQQIIQQQQMQVAKAAAAAAAAGAAATAKQAAKTVVRDTGGGDKYSPSAKVTKVSNAAFVKIAQKGNEKANEPKPEKLNPDAPKLNNPQK